MYGAAVPPPASNNMHPPMDYSMPSIPVAIPQFDYSNVVNGPSMDMVMMGNPHNNPAMPMVHPPQSFMPTSQGYNQQYTVTSQTYAPSPQTSTYTPSYSSHPAPAYISMSQPHPNYEPLSMMSSSQYISPLQPQSHQVKWLFCLWVIFLFWLHQIWFKDRMLFNSPKNLLNIKKIDALKCSFNILPSMSYLLKLSLSNNLTLVGIQLPKPINSAVLSLEKP